jgi:dCTP deaminase
MILKYEEIRDQLNKGKDIKTIDPLVIVPDPIFENPDLIGSASVDLRLGTWFVALRQARMKCLCIGESEAHLTKTHYVPYNKEYILHPKAFVLGVTLEWVRLPKNLTAYIVGKSSWGRRGLIIATATGVHPGFSGSLVLEITNVGEIPIEIRPGLPICQMFLHEVSPGSKTDKVDPSQYVGQRKPELGNIVLDSISKKLAGITTD